jgi:hypothetical protein
MVYYLVQAYKKEIDIQYQRHLYPSYLTSYHMKKGGDSFGLQSGMTDALKFLDEKTAEEWKEIAERTYDDREFEVVPFDGRIFGRVEPRFVVTDNFIGIYGYSHGNPPKCDNVPISQAEYKPHNVDEFKARAAYVRRIVDGICTSTDKIQSVTDEICKNK